MRYACSKQVFSHRVWPDICRCSASLWECIQNLVKVCLQLSQYPNIHISVTIIYYRWYTLKWANFYLSSDLTVIKCWEWYLASRCTVIGWFESYVFRPIIFQLYNLSYSKNNLTSIYLLITIKSLVTRCTAGKAVVWDINFTNYA